MISEATDESSAAFALLGTCYVDLFTELAGNPDI